VGSIRAAIISQPPTDFARLAALSLLANGGTVGGRVKFGSVIVTMRQLRRLVATRRRARERPTAAEARRPISAPRRPRFSSPKSLHRPRPSHSLSI